MFDTLKPYLAIAVLALASLGTYWVNNLYHEAKDLKAANAVLVESIGLMKKVNTTTVTVLTKRADSSKAISQRASNVQLEIEKRFPALGVAVLPGAFRVLHDAAALDQVPAAPGGADEAPVTPKEAATTITSNYEVCHDNADRLQKLQWWVTGVSNEGK